MRRSSGRQRKNRSNHRSTSKRVNHVSNRRRDNARPAAAYRQRANGQGNSSAFYAQEDWYEPTDREEIEFIVRESGNGYVHPVTPKQVRKRLAELPERFTAGIEVVQFSPMTRKRALFPCYGMQWGPNIYLYPIEDSYVEVYSRPPRPQQLVEARMFGGKWIQDGQLWRLEWTPQAIQDFYLNNVLIHEVGHVNDHRNTNFDDREKFANWFAIEYGFRRSRGRV